MDWPSIQAISLPKGMAQDAGIVSSITVVWKRDGWIKNGTLPNWEETLLENKGLKKKLTSLTFWKTKPERLPEIEPD